MLKSLQWKQILSQRLFWLLLILLLAAGLRLIAVGEIPPGLTHDEADHGLDAWGVVNGIRPIYFTVGFGREPLYDYSTAGLMSFLGPTYLAGRLTSVFFSLFTIAIVYAWVRRAFNWRTALWTAAGLAVGFWPLMSGRQALRSITLPALFGLAVLLYWQGMERVQGGRRSWPLFLGAGLALGLSIYTYIPARALWLLFPLLLFYWLLVDRTVLRRLLPGTLLTLLLALLVAWPLLSYLQAHPTAETRIDELSRPLAQAADGDWGPLLDNAFSGLGIFTFQGDGAWRYNIPGRPLLLPGMGILFYAGLLLAAGGVFLSLRGRPHPLLPGGAAAFSSLLWLAIGLAPVLVTGRDLSTTQAVGLQPVLYLFPALALSAADRLPALRRWAAPAGILLLTLVLAVTVRDYFFRWASAPEVRVQYESALLTTVNYVNKMDVVDAAVSTTTPGPFHSPAVALLTLENPAAQLRWFDGRYSLLLPDAAAGELIFSGFAPLNEHLQGYFSLSAAETIPQPASDLDQPLTVYRVNGPLLAADWQAQFDGQIVFPEAAAGPVMLGEAAEFLGYELQTPRPAPGETVRLVTLWRVAQPLANAVLFSQVLGSDGRPVAQADRLDVPGEFWIAGDYFLQLHEFSLPADLKPGSYPLHVGLYRAEDFSRLPVLLDGAAAGDHLELAPLEVGP